MSDDVHSRADSQTRLTHLKSVDAQTTLTKNLTKYFKHTNRESVPRSRNFGTSTELVQVEVQCLTFFIGSYYFLRGSSCKRDRRCHAYQFGMTGIYVFYAITPFLVFVFQGALIPNCTVSVRKSSVAMLKVYQQDSSSRRFHLVLCRPLVETGTDYCIACVKFWSS